MKAIVDVFFPKGKRRIEVTIPYALISGVLAADIEREVDARMVELAARGDAQAASWSRWELWDLERTEEEAAREKAQHEEWLALSEEEREAASDKALATEGWIAWRKRMMEEIP